ncbi:hypothetical protein GGX14DRAFT_407924 [Mycena pura]|uniref:GATA-type domain-containing protein n=1 Tax=Mycena pura TaxID=153505 RepID=A0AAD6URB2_9AGAR|nr:hypothetical protein GGX14DRAFT_407924 [Mycena pura]
MSGPPYHRSEYSSLATALSYPTRPPSAAPPYQGGTGGHAYTNTPSSRGGHPHPSPQVYPHGHGYDPQYSMPATQYPQTPYTSGPAGHYPDAAAHNMQYAGSGHGYGPSTWSGAPSAPAQYYGTAHGPGPATSSRAHAAAPAPAPEIKQCYHCGATSTPLWRRDAATHRTLCNACGLYQQQRNLPRPRELIEADQEEDEEDDGGGGDGPVCSHCQTRQTSVWRRNEDGDHVCNACGVYKRLRGRERPLSLKKNKVKPRAKHSQA